MGNLFQELKRRKVYNVITAYVVTSWLILQVADTLFPAFNLHDNAIRIPALLLLIGFPKLFIFPILQASTRVAAETHGSVSIRGSRP